MEIEAFHKRMEHAISFIWIYRRTSGREPNVAKIAHHLECRGESNIVLWISPDDHYKADELVRKGL